MKKYNMKINPHIVTLMIFLFVSSVFTSTASINATILQQPNSSQTPKLHFRVCIWCRETILILKK